MTTIAAIATPAGYGGIGIIKISGPESIPIARQIFSKTCSTYSKGDTGRDAEFESHRLYLGNIHNPRNGHIIDEVLMAVMKAPHSYTCEDVVEIQAHSGPVALQEIMEMVLLAGARLADPGEFTRRAFLNGRIDLTQAEAVMDLIHARSATAVKAAGVQISGGLKERIEAIRLELQTLYAQIEAGIDFPEDVPEDIDAGEMVKTLNTKIISPIKQLARQHEQMRYFREGLALAIAGKPNVGKSSLLNRLLQQERAIVTEEPGTTRDVIRERLIINGLPIDVLDTAGIRSSKDPIEKLGIMKAQDCIDQADIVLLLIDAHRKPDLDDYRIYSKIKDKNCILVFNKKDLIKTQADTMSVAPEEWQNHPRVMISAKTGDGIDRLVELIETVTVGSIETAAISPIIPNLRHKLLFDRCLENLQRAEQALSNRQPLELVAVDFAAGLKQLDDVLGVRAGTEIVDHIFDQFCIGK
jgi:tRNA modification GTPase